MKPLFSTLLVALLLAGCTEAVIEPVVPVAEVKEAPAPDLCQYAGVLRQNECGLYIELNGGRKLYADNGIEGGLNAGQKVRLGFATATYSQNGDAGSSGHSGGCGSQQRQSSCMEAYGIQAVSVTCIRPDTNN
jgi:hypothetical protein